MINKVMDRLWLPCLFMLLIMSILSNTFYQTNVSQWS